MQMIHIFSAAPFAPLLASIFVGLFGKYFGKGFSHTTTILGVGVAFVVACYTLYLTISGYTANLVLYEWLRSGSYTFEVGFMIDNLTALMMVVVTFVSLMVHIYTVGYMKDDPGYSRFFSYISLFTFAMLMLVMSNNFLQLFFGWEGVGLVSYLLIGFWYKKPTAIHANLKAFLVNRVGDIGLALGIALILFWFGSLDYDLIFNRAASLGGEHMMFGGTSVSIFSMICILLFIGAMGKSAQIPLHVWLPDSMEGPTPISALIHAATMVTAGIFMVARLSPLYELSDTALSFITIIGAITALSMGLMGIIQNDIKRVIAYSTLSQLGYMTVALGVSAYSVAIFHLMTHAFFKALLFLAAGSVIIGMHHDQDIRNMGNLKKYMPVTWITFLIGSVALIGTPFFSGFYSKEIIIEAAKFSSIYGSSVAYWMLLIGVFCTALYSSRLYFLVFHGQEKWRLSNTVKHGHGLNKSQNPHESQSVITTPLVLLAIPSVVIGFITIEPLLFGDFFNRAIVINHDLHQNLGEIQHHFSGAFAMGLHGFLTLPFALMILGLIVGWWMTSKATTKKTPNKFISSLKGILEQGYGFDRFYEHFLAKGIRQSGEYLWSRIDVNFIDRIMVNGTAHLVGRASKILKGLQSGYIYHYAFIMIIGLFLIMTFFIKL